MGARSQFFGSVWEPVWAGRTPRGGDGRESRIFAILPFFFGLLLLGGCVHGGGRPSPLPAPGVAVVESEQYSEETGRIIRRERTMVRQNEAPEGRTEIRLKPAAGGLDVNFGGSWKPEIPGRLSHVEKPVALAGVGVLVLGALLGGIGRHWRLTGLAGFIGLLLLAISVTMERYAWVYGVGVLVAGTGAGWLAWSAYQGGKREKEVLDG